MTDTAGLLELLSPLVVLAALALLHRSLSRVRHRRALANIARLEVELGLRPPSAVARSGSDAFASLLAEAARVSRRSWMSPGQKRQDSLEPADGHERMDVAGSVKMWPGQ